MFIDFREGKGRREGGEKHQHERKHQSGAAGMCTDRGTSPPPFGSRDFAPTKPHWPGLNLTYFLIDQLIDIYVDKA